MYEELDAAAAVHRRLGCAVIDVSELSVEETAMRIIKVVDHRTATGPMSRRSLWRAEGRTLDDKGWVPLRYWAAWGAALAARRRRSSTSC